MELLTLLLTAHLTPLLAAPREYHLVDLAKSWHDAQSYCREKFADLATMETEEEWTKVKTLVANSPHSLLWIGLYDDVYSWRWSLDNSSIYEGENLILGSWFVPPSDWGVETHCGRCYQGRFYFAKCEQTLRSICYDEASNTYIPVTDTKTWFDALSYCRATYTDLAIIKTQQDMDAFNTVAASSATWWVGLSRNGWAWSDKSDFTLTTWDTSKSEPNGGKSDQCVCTKVNGWHDGRCATEYPFICTVPISKVLNIGLKTDNSVDLNDLHVRESLLGEIETRLRAQGTNKFRVTWKAQPNGEVFNKD